MIRANIRKNKKELADRAEKAELISNGGAEKKASHSQVEPEVIPDTIEKCSRATIRTDDHHYDGMIQELIDKARKARSFTKKTSIVLNEVVSCLLKSADCWISSCLIVAENYKESYEKSKKFDKNSLYPHKVPLEDHALYAPCVEVVVQVEFDDVIDKAEGIRSGEDLKAVLQELGSMKSVGLQTLFGSLFCYGKKTRKHIPTLLIDVYQLVWGSPLTDMLR